MIAPLLLFLFFAAHSIDQSRLSASHRKDLFPQLGALSLCQSTPLRFCIQLKLFCSTSSLSSMDRSRYQQLKFRHHKYNLYLQACDLKHWPAAVLLAEALQWVSFCLDGHVFHIAGITSLLPKMGPTFAACQ